MPFIGKTDFNHKNNPAQKAVLLCNLGTPDQPTAQALRRYLKQFLSDPRVVEIPRVLWKIILFGFILPLRPKRSATMYQKVWTEQGSPLLNYSLEQQQKLQEKLAALEAPVNVELAMCYGNPSIEKAIENLEKNNVQDIMILPLYPQYCGATTGATFDAVTKELMKRRWIPKISFLNGYHKEPLFIEAVGQSIQQHIQQHGMPDKLIFSYHGTPKRNLEKGDPYYCYCMQTTRLVKEHCELSDEHVLTTFQSRFGKAEWLQPYTEPTLIELAKEHKHVAVICPGFSVDCLETLEEIEQEARDAFISHGGETFHYIPALNASDMHIELFTQLAHRELNISP